MIEVLFVLLISSALSIRALRKRVEAMERQIAKSSTMLFNAVAIASGRTPTELLDAVDADDAGDEEDES